MGKRTAVSPIEATPQAGHTPALRVEEVVFVSAQQPRDLMSGEIVGETIEAQTQQAMSNLAAVLNPAGCTVNDCVRVTVYLADLGEREAFDRTYQRWFRAPLPARTVLGATLEEGVRVQIEATAIRGSAS